MSDARSSAHISKPAATVGEHSELVAEASAKAVWWGMRLASLLTHLSCFLFVFFPVRCVSTIVVNKDEHIWIDAVTR